MISLFAAASGPHISLKAERLFDVGPVTITNAYIYGVMVAIATMLIARWVANRISVQPSKGPVQLAELLLEFIITLISGPLGSRKKAIKYAPIFGTFFIFIVLSNLSGLLPLVGSGIAVGETPVFRPLTADLNGTIALSIVAIIAVQYLSIKESGIKGHLKHYFTDKPLNPVNMFVGLFEMLGEITRIASLSLRLFLNTAVGEILVSVAVFIGSYGSSFTLLPIVAFEILVAFIQAYVFTTLCATYLGLATHHSHEDPDASEDMAKKSAHPSPAQLNPSGA